MMPGSRRLVRVSFVALGIAAALPAMAFACNGSNGALGGTPSGDDGGATDEADAPTTPLPSEDAPTSLVGDTAPGIDTFVPLNPYDGSSVPEGGARTDPGVLECPYPNTCNQFAGDRCCVGEEGGACVVPGVTCPASGVTVTCNQIADCRVGTLCCGTVAVLDDGGFTSVNAACAAGCDAGPPSVQLCRTSGECPDGGPCVVQACSDGNRYELCGVYTSPPDAGFVFNCAPL